MNVNDRFCDENIWGYVLSQTDKKHHSYTEARLRNIILTQKPGLLKIIMEFNKAGEICLAFVA
jgi:hypothetical protein